MFERQPARTAMILGTVVNTSAVIAGSVIGLTIGSRLPARLKTSLLHALGIFTIFIGIKMSLQTERVLPVLVSLVLGTIAGELLKIPHLLDRIDAEVKARGSQFTKGFFTATILFCVGAMTIVGSLEDGIRGDSSILLTKAAMDGVASVALSSALGVGVLFASLSVLVIQGSISLIGSHIAFLARPQVISSISGLGGIMIIGIGLNLLGIVRIRVESMLPALLIIVAISL